MTDEMLDKMRKFTQFAASHMYEAAILKGETPGQVNLLITSDAEGINLVEKFLVGSPINISTLLNEIEALRDGIKEAAGLDDMEKIKAKLNKLSEGGSDILMKQSTEIETPPEANA